MSDRLQEIRARLAGAHEGMPWEAWEGCVSDKGGEVVCRAAPLDAEFIAHAPRDIAWLLDEVERLRDYRDRNMPWWRRDADGSLWVAPPTVGGAPELDSEKWVRVQ